VENKVIPISDINPARNVPVVSRIFIVISSLTFLFLQPKNNIDLLNYFYKYAAIPCELINNLPISANQFYNNNCSLEPDIVIFPDKNILLSIIVSLFLHANFLHILGNLWSFWIFGNNVEDKLGKIRFILFLIVSGVISIVGHSLLNFGNLNPIVGASGIVSALMGAYFIFISKCKIISSCPFWCIFSYNNKRQNIFMIFLVNFTVHNRDTK
jgi:Uncharacterized membrane protein (homolog of Drosophila rhomboid)